MVSCTAIEAQIVFETLLELVAGQLAIAGQLGREVHPQSIGLLLGSGGWRWLGGRILSGRGRRRRICLALGGRGTWEENGIVYVDERIYIPNS